MKTDRQTLAEWFTKPMPVRDDAKVTVISHRVHESEMGRYIRALDAEVTALSKPRN